MGALLRDRWVIVAAVGVLMTAVLLVLALVDGPPWLRTPLALIVFLAATGFALTGPGDQLTPALRWTLVLGLSVTADLLYAVLLLVANVLSLPAFVGLLVATQVAALAVHTARAARRARLAASK